VKLPAKPPVLEVRSRWQREQSERKPRQRCKCCHRYAGFDGFDSNGFCLDCRGKAA